MLQAAVSSASSSASFSATAHGAAVMPAAPLPEMLQVPLWRPADNQGHYWPCELLHAFTLQMATRGMSVLSDMMLGDSVYALEKLCAAHASGDERLRALATQLFEFFDARDGAGAH